jgi:hypothetical protein
MWVAGDLWIPPEKREFYAERGEFLYPRKRFRHARRYYRRLRREAEADRMPDPEGWFDLWHTHPDWRGHGNRGARHRRQHLHAGFIIFERYLREAADIGRPMQVFMTIDALDSSQEAVWVHTTNLNRDNFPYTFPTVRWDVAPPPILREFLRGRPWQLGRAEGSPGLYWVRPMESAT